jgi:hypothetical protein
MELKDILINIILFCFVLIVIIFLTILILNQFAPFRQCEDKDDNFVVQFGKDYFTCAELRAVNVTGSVRIMDNNTTKLKYFPFIPIG